MLVMDFLGRFDCIPEFIRDDLGTAVTLVCKHQGRQFRDSGEPYLEHIFDVTYQLIRIGCDKAAIIAGCLHDIVEDTAVDLELVKQEFGEEVAFIVGANSKRAKENFPDKDARLNEFHERFVASAKQDSRVIWPKLADRTHNLATLHGLHNDPSKQQRIAKETLGFYIPFLDKVAPTLITEAMQVHLARFKHRMYHLSMAYIDPAPE